MKIKYNHSYSINRKKFLNTYIRQFGRYINHADIAIDIGANDGDTTLCLAECVGENGKVIAFEPSVAFELLEKNVNDNKHICNFDIYNFGLSNKDMEADFFTTAIKDNGGIVDHVELPQEKRVANSRHQFVNAKEFLYRNYKNNLDKIKFIKIDTEGHDYIIINNLKPFLQQYKPVLFVEWFHLEHISQKLFNTIDNIGYEAYHEHSLEKIFHTNFHNKKTENLILLPKGVSNDTYA